MVYDVPRNYIGDTHWREEEPVQDGDEFEIDRPILVQVGEQVGSIEQDLTGLLEKRRKKDLVIDKRGDLHSSSLLAPMTASESRTGTAISTLLRPKSLNALLGTSQRTIRKASLPMKSPYELRRAAGDASRDTEPPAKRRRIKSPAECAQPPIDQQHLPRHTFERQVRNENVGKPDQAIPCSVLEMPRSDEQSITVTGLKAKSPLTTLKATEKATLRRDTESQLGDLKISFRKERGHDKKEGFKAVELIEMDRKVQSRARKPGRLETQSSESSYQETLQTPAQKRLPEPPETVKTLFDIELSKSNSSGQSKPRSKLRLASCKPRQKLMYRDLLPQDVLAVGKASNSANPNRESKKVKLISEHREMQLNASLSKRHQDEQDRLEARLRTLHDKVRLRDEENLLSPKRISGNHNRPQNGKGSAPDPLKRGGEMKQVKDIIEGARSPSVQAIEPIPKTNSTVQDTNFALARMDEILLSRSQPQKPARLAGQQFVDDDSTVQHAVLSSIEPTLADPILRDPNTAQTLPKAQEMPASHCESITQIRSSQPFKTQIASSPKGQRSRAIKDGKETPENLSLAASSKQPLCDSTADVVSPRTGRSPMLVSPKPKSLDIMAPHKTLQAAQRGANPISLTTLNTCETSPASLGAVKALGLLATPSLETSSALLDSVRLQNASGRVFFNDPKATKAVTGLPQFRPLQPTAARQRSPIKKSTSDTSAATGARNIFYMGNSAATVRDANYMKEQSASPWSREAWDLFGCGRNGKPMDFGNFCLNEGV